MDRAGGREKGEEEELSSLKSSKRATFLSEKKPAPSTNVEVQSLFGRSQAAS